LVPNYEHARDNTTTVRMDERIENVTKKKRFFKKKQEWIFLPYFDDALIETYQYTMGKHICQLMAMIFPKHG